MTHGHLGGGGPNGVTNRRLGVDKLGLTHGRLGGGRNGVTHGRLGGGRLLVFKDDFFKDVVLVQGHMRSNMRASCARPVVAEGVVDPAAHSQRVRRGCTRVIELEQYRHI